MHGLFGEIQVSKEAHQRRQNSARFRPVKGHKVLLSCSGTRGGIYAKLANGMANVFIGSLDPNQAVSGKVIQIGPARH
jgi:hypothetical protein